MALWTFLQGVVAEAYKYFWVGSVCVCSLHFCDQWVYKIRALLVKKIHWSKHLKHYHVTVIMPPMRTVYHVSVSKTF